MQDLTVTLIQTALVWENIDANLRRFDDLLSGLRDTTDLIVLPEMFTTGFSMNAASLAQDMQGTAVAWLRRTARRFHAVVTGSIIIVEKGKYYNRLCWADPDGGLQTYDKKHLFRYAGEEKVYTAGDSRLLVEIKDWRIRPFICYDLMFPAWNRNMDNEYDLAVYIANWPEKRSEHWKTLLQARAIENQVYVVGVNRIGTDGHGLSYNGDSSIIDPQGNILFRNAHAPCLYSAQLDYGLMNEFRRSFPAWMDADQFLLR